MSARGSPAVTGAIFSHDFKLERLQAPGPLFSFTLERLQAPCPLLSIKLKRLQAPGPLLSFSRQPARESLGELRQLSGPQSAFKEVAEVFN
jgi:hypothetical protein